MKLAYRYFGGEGNAPLIILHGLLGSSRNWITIGKALASQYEVFALDLRNHGDSPHDSQSGFDDMAADVEDFLEQQGLKSAHILGHSLGGKVAMHLAVADPARVDSLTVVDIAPKSYPPYHIDDFEGMRALDLDALTTRKEADTFLKGPVPDFGQRQFLLTNLKRDGDGKFKWGVNLEVLYQNLDTLRQNSLPDGETYTGPTLFVLGEHSKFVRTTDHEAIRRFFPKAQIRTVADSGHNPHTEQPQAFLAIMEDFFSSLVKDKVLP
ncbi:alpha/beta fold hydrolase [Ruficoccus sp. ZRK36]|uniref:alpha/beta fold hydrolase n=1 Tax=Ruficoccus sp. ZRK36 TaxID=2866311 RepID=UPI001C730E6F|nr:alpha/beta fold hydrolase [Ruficoccus sp. ZRK36]QYY34890.1 alpha/beta fold hydrolase [Ruficoccus sp. ZRK36]